MSQQSQFSSETRAFDLLASRVGYAYINSDQIIETSSGIIQQLSASPESDIVGLPVTEAFLEFLGHESVFDSILSGEIPFLKIQEINRPNVDGTIDYFDFSMYPIEEQNPGRGLMLLAENSTPQGLLMQELTQQRNELRLTQSELAKANLELHSLNDLKSIFLSMAAHDLRSPLSVIASYADLMLEPFGDDPPFEYDYVMSRVLEQSMWLNTLIDDVLNLNMIEQGKLPVNRVPIDIHNPIIAVVNQFGPVLATRNILVKVEAADDAIMVSADSNRIKQIAFNLIGNGAKFMAEKGEIIVSIKQDSETNEVVLSFADNGPGIAEDQLDQLFQIFYRTPGASRYKGTGLGLYIVKTLTELHDGVISVESKLREGTTMQIRLPLLNN